MLDFALFVEFPPTARPLLRDGAHGLASHLVVEGLQAPADADIVIAGWPWLDEIFLRELIAHVLAEGVYSVVWDEEVAPHHAEFVRLDLLLNLEHLEDLAILGKGRIQRLLHFLD